MGVEQGPPLSFQQDARPSTAQRHDSGVADTTSSLECSLVPEMIIQHVEASSQPASTALRPVSNDHDDAYADTPSIQQQSPAMMSHIARDFVDRIKQLNKTRQLHCTDEDPLSFTGEEAVNIMQELLPSKLQPILSHKVARALMHTSPSLISPVSYSDKPMHKNALHDSPFALYSIVEEAMVQGVYTEISPCYTYDCRATNGCYAPTCPYRSAFRPTALINRRVSSCDSIASITLSRASLREIHRQEAILEIIDSEEKYMEDLRVLDLLFAKPLLSAPFIDKKRRDQFCRDVFSNYLDILHIHQDLLRDLHDRHLKATGYIDKVGCVFLRHLPRFTDAYTQYSSNAVFATFTIQHETRSNKSFRHFLQENERKAECRRLSFRHFLFSPLLRIQCYLPLIQAILNKTPEENPDYDDLIQCMQVVREIDTLVDGLYPVQDTAMLIYEVNNNLTFNPDDAQRTTTPDKRMIQWRRVNSDKSEDMAKELCKKVTFARTVQELRKKKMIFPMLGI